MADVFISYKRVREHLAAHLTDILEANGYSVWYDRKLKGGQVFDEEILRQLEAARAIVVLWCTSSVLSEWVLYEAATAMSRDVIVPVWLDEARPPEEYGRIHTINLASWDGSPGGEEMIDLFDGISFRVGRERRPQVAELDRYSRLWGRFGAPPLQKLAELRVKQEDPSGPRPPLQGRIRKRLMAPSNIRTMWERVKASRQRSQIDTIVPDVLAQAPDSDVAFEVQARLREFSAAERPLRARSAAMTGSAVVQRTYRIAQFDLEGWTHPEMVVVPPGRFWMGRANAGDVEGTDLPQHEVTIAEPFAMGKHPVTREEVECWKRATGDPAYRDCGAMPGFDQRRHPATHMSWNDAQQFIRWLNRIVGLEGRRDCYRLPTEAEWEYACRARVDGPRNPPAYSFGEKVSDVQVNFADGADIEYRRWQRTTQMGSHPPNDFGLHDMHGNVWEWVEDCWRADYKGAPVDGSAWLSGSCDKRVMRGGSWYDKAGAAKSHSRNRSSPTDRNYRTGFRLCRSLSAPLSPQ